MFYDFLSKYNIILIYSIHKTIVIKTCILYCVDFNSGQLFPQIVCLKFQWAHGMYTFIRLRTYSI